MNELGNSFQKNHFKKYLVQKIDDKSSYEDLLIFPRYFEIETINACNARCPMCTIEDWPRSRGYMSDELFSKIAHEIAGFKRIIKKVSLFRDSEPLLDKKLSERILLMKKLGVPNVGISTNLSLLDEDRSISLLEAGIDDIILSIDSLKKDVFERIRVNLEFETVIENAHRFISLRNQIRPETAIRIRMIRQPLNHTEWPEYFEYWQPKLSIHDTCRYLNLHNWGGQLRDYKPVDLPQKSTLPCLAHWSLMAIFADGSVPMCNIDYGIKYPNGTVQDQTIAEIWHSQTMAERRRHHLSGNRGKNNLCLECNVWDDFDVWNQVSGKIIGSPFSK